MKRHRFFRGVDWDKLALRQALPPFVPKASSPTDTSYFEAEPVEPDDPEVDLVTVPEGAFRCFG